MMESPWTPSWLTQVQGWPSQALVGLYFNDDSRHAVTLRSGVASERLPGRRSHAPRRPRDRRRRIGRAAGVPSRVLGLGGREARGLLIVSWWIGGATDPPAIVFTGRR